MTKTAQQISNAINVDQYKCLDAFLIDLSTHNAKANRQLGTLADATTFLSWISPSFFVTGKTTQHAPGCHFSICV